MQSYGIGSQAKMGAAYPEMKMAAPIAAPTLIDSAKLGEHVMGELRQVQRRVSALSDALCGGIPRDANVDGSSKPYGPGMVAHLAAHWNDEMMIVQAIHNELDRLDSALGVNLSASSINVAG